MNLKEQQNHEPGFYNYKKLSGILLMIISITTLVFLLHSLISSASPALDNDPQKLLSINYFTIQSNIIVFLWLTALSIHILSNHKSLKFVVNINLASTITTYILVTGIIYWCVLVPMLVTGSSQWLFSSSNIWLHTTTPIISVVMYFYARSYNKSTKPKPRLLYFLIYPLFYITFAIYYAIDGVYLYPMFNPVLLGSWLGVALFVLVIAIVFTGIYLLMLYGFPKKAKSRDIETYK